MSDPRKTLLLLTVDTEASMAGLRPLPPEAMVYGRVGGAVYGIERIMDCCDARGFRATFFVSALEALHYGDGHVQSICAAVLARGHDVQLHIHPIWLGGEYTSKLLASYGYAQQLAAIERGRETLERAAGRPVRAHRAGGLSVNGESLRALAALGIGLDSSVACGFRRYGLAGLLGEPTVPRRLGGVVEVPVTTFAQVRLGSWAPRRHFDVNADSLAELRWVLSRAVAERVAAVTLLMHSFSFIRRDAGRGVFWPAEGELRKFERLLDHAAGLSGLEVTTFTDLAGRLESAPELLDGPAFSPNSGLVRTYCRTWQRFGSSWKSKALALGLPVAAAGLVALAVGILRWLAS